MWGSTIWVTCRPSSPNRKPRPHLTPPTMSAASLYEALHDTISEQMSLDDPLSMLEIVGALELVKHDLLTEFDSDDDGEPVPMEGACMMPEAA
jgi:hypothetical protein